MPVICPLCRASNDRGPTCRRCRADLSLLFAVEAKRDALLAAARSCIAQGSLDRASELVNWADELRQGADTARLRAAISLLRRDFAAAWNEYRQAHSLSGG